MCDCRKDLEQKLTERYQAQEPTARDHKVTLRGYGFVLEGNKFTERGCMTYETFALVPLKKGGEKPKKTKGNMFFSFCPFCGEKVGAECAALSQQPATGEPALFIHPDTFAMNNAHVGAWKPGYELTSYIPLYTHPAPSAPGDDFDLICNAIDKADTITMEGDYMLDSDDCIAVVRVMQVLLSVRAAIRAAK